MDFLWGNPGALALIAAFTGSEATLGEVKHLSNRRKRKRISDPVCSGERKQDSPNRG
jgi:hypothetical protein